MNNQVHLEIPQEWHRAAWEDIMAEYEQAGETPMPGILRSKDGTFESFLEKSRSRREQQGEVDNRVPESAFFLMEGERILGCIALRHFLSEVLENGAGHIGYGVRPSERRKGYATRMLTLALEESHKLGLKRVLLSCDADNIASRRTMERCGGVFFRELEEDGEKILQYWIETCG